MWVSKYSFWRADWLFQRTKLSKREEPFSIISITVGFGPIWCQCSKFLCKFSFTFAFFLKISKSQLWESKSKSPDKEWKGDKKCLRLLCLGLYNISTPLVDNDAPIVAHICYINLLRCDYYDEYLACKQEDFCERYINFKGNWELLSGERLAI